MTELVRVTRGVWRSGDSLEDLAGRAAALLAACPPGSVIGGITAARLHGLWLPPLPDGPIEVIVHREVPKPALRAGSRRPELRARRQMLRPDEIGWVDGLPVTDEARTWLDLATRLALPDLVAAGDSVLRGPTTPEQLAAVVHGARRRRGIVRARTVLPLLDRRSRSRPESHMRFAIVSSGLPRPEVNEPVHTETGEWLAEPDLSYDDVRLAIEYNGADHALKKRMRRDITREIDVTIRGRWRVVTFGPAEVFGHPDLVALAVRELRAEQSHALRGPRRVARYPSSGAL